MNRINRILGVLGGLACALLAFVATGPAAFAMRVPPSGGTARVTPPASVHVVTVGGMPGWQISLIALGAALLTAAAVILLGRARAARRTPSTIRA
jgi:hypothetical protein